MKKENTYSTKLKSFYNQMISLGSKISQATTFYVTLTTISPSFDFSLTNIFQLILSGIS